MGKIYCSECGIESDDSVKFCSNCGKPLNDENETFNSINESNNKNISINNDMLGKIKVLPIVVGCVLSFVLWILAVNDIFGVEFSALMSVSDYIPFCILFGSLFAGFLCKDSFIIALIYGLIISIVVELVFLYFSIYFVIWHDNFYFVGIMAGLLGTFVGNFIRTKIKN